MDSFHFPPFLETNLFAIMAKFYKKLIEMVKSQPALYDVGHPDYKNVLLKKKIWDEMGKKLNMSGKDVKFKWKNIRGTYSKYLKSIKTPNKEQSASQHYTRYSRWQWASQMQFLEDHMGVTAVADNTLEQEEEDQEEEDQVEEDQVEEDQEETISEIMIKSEDSYDNNFSSGSNQVPITFDDPNFNLGSNEGPMLSDNNPNFILGPSDVPSLSYDNKNFIWVSAEGSPLRNRQHIKRNVKKKYPIKLISCLNSKAKKLSSVEHLMLGYAKTIESFSERRKILTKMKIAQIIMEAELEEEEECSQSY